MRNTDEQIPIRERWTAQLPGGGDEAIAGALLRSAAQASPLDEGKLAEIRARLRTSERSRGRAVPRPARRLLRPAVVAAGLILFGGALSAAVSHVIHRIPNRPSEAQTAEPVPTKNPIRHARAKAVKLGDPAAPEAAAETPTPVSPGVPLETPKRERAVDQPAPPPAVRLSRPSRSLALRETPSLQPSERGPSPLEPEPVVRPLPAPSELARESQPLPAPSELARESRLVASAIAKLRQDGDAEAALTILDRHRAEFAAGALRPEATATRIEALLRLGRNRQALALLDAQSLSAKGVGREMLVARAELRADRAGIRLHFTTSTFFCLPGARPTQSPSGRFMVAPPVAPRAAIGMEPGATSRSTSPIFRRVVSPSKLVRPWHADIVERSAPVRTTSKSWRK